MKIYLTTVVITSASVNLISCSRSTPKKLLSTDGVVLSGDHLSPIKVIAKENKESTDPSLTVTLRDAFGGFDIVTLKIEDGNNVSVEAPHSNYKWKARVLRSSGHRFVPKEVNIGAPVTACRGSFILVGAPTESNDLSSQSLTRCFDYIGELARKALIPREVRRLFKTEKDPRCRGIKVSLTHLVHFTPKPLPISRKKAAPQVGTESQSIVDESPGQTYVSPPGNTRISRSQNILTSDYGSINQKDSELVDPSPRGFSIKEIDNRVHVELQDVEPSKSVDRKGAMTLSTILN